MKTLLTLLLLIPSLSWGSEKKARELYVNAKADLMKNGCGFEMLVSKFGEAVYDIDNVDVKEISPLIEELKKCGYYYKDNTLPVFDKIISDYADTEVAYNLMSGEEYISEGLLMGLLVLLETNDLEIKKELKKQEQKLEKELKRQEAIKKENLKYQEAEPMTVKEVSALVNQVEGCVSLPKNIELPAKKVTVNIQVNKDRTIKSYKLDDYNILWYKNTKDWDAKTIVLREIASRALNNPDCEILNLPPEKYFHWREINFTFDFEALGLLR